MLHHQRSDGSWALYYDGPADLSTTIEAYVALKVLGIDPERDEMRKALEVILRRRRRRKRARLHQDLARALRHLSVVGRAVASARDRLLSAVDAVQSLRLRLLGARHGRAADDRRLEASPIRALGVDVSEIVAPGTRRRDDERTRPAPLADARRDGCRNSTSAFRNSRKREEAQRRVAQWIVERQEADGSWGGIQPPWVYSLIALDLMGYALDHPVMRKGIAGMKPLLRIDDARGLAFLGLHVAGVGHGLGGARARACGLRSLASGDAPRGAIGCCASRFPTMRPATGG